MPEALDPLLDNVDDFDELDQLVESRDAANAKAKQARAKENAEKRTPQADKLIALSSAAKLFHIGRQLLCRY